MTRGANGGIAIHDLNRVQLIGHLGQDPETTYTGHRYSPDHLQRSDQRSLEGCGRPGTGSDRVDTVHRLGCAGRDLRAVCVQRQPRLRRRPAPYAAVGGCRNRRTPCPRRDRARRPHPTRPPRWSDSNQGRGARVELPTLRPPSSLARIGYAYREVAAPLPDRTADHRPSRPDGA